MMSTAEVKMGLAYLLLCSLTANAQTSSANEVLDQFVNSRSLLKTAVVKIKGVRTRTVDTEVKERHSIDYSGYYDYEKGLEKAELEEVDLITEPPTWN